MRSIINEHGENINYSFTLGIALDSANTLSYSISNLLMARKPQVFEAISSCRNAHGTKKGGRERMFGRLICSLVQCFMATIHGQD